MDGIKEKMGDEVNLIHLNLLSAPGRKVAQAFRVPVVPATLLFTGDGQLTARRIGMPDKEQLAEEIKHALAPLN